MSINVSATTGRRAERWQRGGSPACGQLQQEPSFVDWQKLALPQPALAGQCSAGQASFASFVPSTGSADTQGPQSSVCLLEIKQEPNSKTRAVRVKFCGGSCY